MRNSNWFLVVSCLVSAGGPAAAQSGEVCFKNCYPPGPELIGGGGAVGIARAIQHRLRYPAAAAAAAGTQGRVFVGFSVLASGDVGGIQILKPLRPDCDSAVVQAVRALPRFKPLAVSQGSSVRCVVPITFSIPKAQAATGQAKRSKAR